MTYICVCLGLYALFIGTSEKETIHWNQLAAPPFWPIALKEFLCWPQPCSSCFSNNCVILNVCHDTIYNNEYLQNKISYKVLLFRRKNCFTPPGTTQEYLQHLHWFTAFTDFIDQTVAYMPIYSHVVRALEEHGWMSFVSKNWDWSRVDTP